MHMVSAVALCTVLGKVVTRWGLFDGALKSGQPEIRSSLCNLPPAVGPQSGFHLGSSVSSSVNKGGHTDVTGLL